MRPAVQEVAENLLGQRLKRGLAARRREGKAYFQLA
jgi:hypothetical protein